MNDPLHFPLEQLPPLEKLLAKAAITPKDIEAAVRAWEENPPDKQFKLMLQAEVNNGS